MPTRTFTRAELDELGFPHCPAPGVVLHREQVDARRWVSVHDLVFCAPDDGRVYRVTYEKGLTEMQDADPWCWDSEITATEVVAQEVTVTRWVPVDEAEPSA